MKADCNCEYSNSNCTDLLLILTLTWKNQIGLKLHKTSLCGGLQIFFFELRPRKAQSRKLKRFWPRMKSNPTLPTGKLGNTAPTTLGASLTFHKREPRFVRNHFHKWYDRMFWLRRIMSLLRTAAIFDDRGCSWCDWWPLRSRYESRTDKSAGTRQMFS